MNNPKPVLLYIAPVLSLSGYGEHARDIARALIKINKYDIKIIPIKWGATPQNALKKGKDDDILNLILNYPLEKKPEYSIQLTVPNEFNNNIAQYNIGITAGIETTACSFEWLKGLNRMDMIIVPSNFSKNVFESTTYILNLPNNTKTEYKCIKPIHVLFEGINTNIFKKINNPRSQLIKKLNEIIKEDFVFLFVGQWLPGELGADRKNVGFLIKTFLETFKNKLNKPALLLKTGIDFSYVEEEELKEKIKNIKNSIDGNLPNIYLLHGDLTPEEMNELYNYNKVKVHISFTRGEGFCRPLLEASMSEKPIIAPAWSGHLDFLPNDKAILLPGKLENVHPSAVWDGVIEENFSWFTVDYSYASSVMLNVWKLYSNYISNAKILAKENAEKFNFNKMVVELEKILDENLPQFSVYQEINIPPLPKLKKIKDE